MDLVRVLGHPAVHQALDFARLVGLRDRLRCPSCAAVGTFKPHGGWLDRADKRKVRRWLCKWCGYYVGPEGVLDAYVIAGIEEWILGEATVSHLAGNELERYVRVTSKATTPERVLRDSPVGRTWPWRG